MQSNTITPARYKNVVDDFTLLKPDQKRAILRLVRCMVNDKHTNNNRYVLTLNGKRYRSNKISSLLTRVNDARSALDRTSNNYKIVSLAIGNRPRLIISGGKS